MSNQNEMGFLENRGQMMDMKGNPVPHVLFKTEAPGMNFWITETGVTIQTFTMRKEPLAGEELKEWEAAGGEQSGRKKTKKFIDWERIDVELKNATINKENVIKELPPNQGHTNYFYPHCPDGIYGVKEYGKVTIKDVYKGIDWVFYRKADGSLKYDFVVHPEADYHQIELLYKSKTPIKINAQGELEMLTAYGNLKENKPVSFYEEKEVVTTFKQNHQKTITINGEQGYETSISFQLPTFLSREVNGLDGGQTPSSSGRVGEHSRQVKVLYL